MHSPFGTLLRLLRSRITRKPRSSSPPSNQRSWGQGVSQGPAAYPLGLTGEQVASLRALRSTPAWRHYSAALSQLYEAEAGKLISGLAHDPYLIVSGRVQAYEHALTLID